ncbi:Mor transcription activator family protein [Desulfuromonas sp. TF]|uniref:Mor transcription activator family protein n=1 Tax=Desulfuromonas sp. TF TaxID=1232410 RepID=UPI000418DEDE|nr:Mor transcription activator family protein [Desulfuromonas sp. TF]
MEESEKRGSQVLFDLARLVTEGQIEAGAEPEQARTIGLKAADQVRRTYGGEQVYIPKGLALALTERDYEIWRKFTGSNSFALAKEYGLTERQIYSILARVRDEEFRKRQMGLFG